MADDANCSAAAASVLVALVKDKTEPGYLDEYEQSAEVLFRILADADEGQHERLADCSETLSIIGELCREVKKSKLEGRFQHYP